MNPPSRPDRLRELVEFLCSPTCAGRAPGTPEGRAARTRIAADMKALGLEPLGDAGEYFQSVPACRGANVLGRLPGRGPHSDRAILVAAHHDHLGRIPGISEVGDARWPGNVYWGADDNAAAVAILIEVARQLASDPRSLGRQVIFAAFDGEEPPYFLQRGMGSLHFAEAPPLPLEQIDLMICLDLMGHALGRPEAGLPQGVTQSFFVLGGERSAGTPELLEALAQNTRDVFPRRMAIDTIPPLSDYAPFEARRVPFLFLTCGRWQHYHRVTDTPDRLDHNKMAAASVYLAELVRGFADAGRAPTAYRDRGRDDRASVETLDALASLLAPHAPAVAQVRPVLEALRAEVAARGVLGAEGRTRLSFLVGALESGLA